MGSSTSTRQTTTQPLIDLSAKIHNPKPIHVHPKFSLGECIFKINNAEEYRDVECKVIFKYVVNDEIYKDIRGKIIKDILHGINGRTEWYLRTYIPIENEDKSNWYVFKTALGNLEETIAIYKLNNFHITFTPDEF